MRTGSVRVGRDGDEVINPLTEALVHDRRQRLLDEASRQRRARPQRTMDTTSARTSRRRAARITSAIVFFHRYTRPTY
jgi:hypothetical protein